MTAAAARKLNALHSADPAYAVARDAFLSTGEMRVDGDLAQLGDWLEAGSTRAPISAIVESG